MRVLTYDGEGIMHIGRSLGQNGARGYKNAAQKFMVLHMWVHLGHGLVQPRAPHPNSVLDPA